MNDQTGSISVCLEKLKQGDEAAAGQIFNRFFRRLVGLARKKLTPLSRQAAADHEDVAVSAFNDFWQAVQTDRYADLHGRDDLWSVLTAFVANKARSLIDRETAKKRGGGGVLHASALDPPTGGSVVSGGLDQFASQETDPAVIAEFEELLDRFQTRLNDTLKEIAAQTLTGYTSEEIGNAIDMPASTVRRKQKVIRAVLAETFSVSQHA